MNRDETRKAIEVMQAWLDGKTLQIRGRYRGEKWSSKQSQDEATWNWGAFDYRIKPAPREFWVNADSDTPGDALPIPLYLSPPKGNWVRVREVLENES